jgi:hypothetical protein
VKIYDRTPFLTDIAAIELVTEHGSNFNRMKENQLTQEKTLFPKDGKLKAWLKKLGVAGFLFFLIKGLVWLGIFIWAGKCALD